MGPTLESFRRATYVIIPSVSTLIPLKSTVPLPFFGVCVCVCVCRDEPQNRARYG
jgi:hypothetical protein